MSSRFQYRAFARFARKKMKHISLFLRAKRAKGVFEVNVTYFQNAKLSKFQKLGKFDF
jgi:hypothetical protein